MKRKKCIHCGKFFPIRKNIKNHNYCSGKECQQARKNAWAKEKYQSDSDYRENKKELQKQWHKKKSGLLEKLSR